MDIIEDSVLVSRLHDDDIGAFDILYHKYHHAIYRNIYKITKDKEISQDILQDVFIVLWEKRYKIKSDQSVSGWLFVISFNRSISYLRKKLRETLAIDATYKDQTESDIEQIQATHDQYCLLYSAIDQLSPQKKKVFTLCKLDGRTYEEAAEELNISKHTVKEYLGHAVLSVKNHMKEHQVEWKSVSILLCFITTGFK